MRRLPVYFVIDVSESMVGEKQRHVERGIRGIMQELMGNPYALETVYISVIVFAGQAQLFVPLTDVCMFSMPSLPVGSGTALAEGLKLLMRELDCSVTKTTRENKGDWKPIVFLFTDGIPTDNPDATIQKWRNEYANRATLVAVSIGEHANTQLLCRLTNNVLRLNKTDDASFSSFFSWVTASIEMSSASLESSGDGEARLPDASGINLEKVTESSSYKTKEDGLILLGQCAQKKEYYLLRFSDAEGSSGDFVLEQCYRIDKESYLALSGKQDVAQHVSSDRLYGKTGASYACPCCGNRVCLVFCGDCGKISCSDGHKAECPWCGNAGVLGTGGAIDVARAQG